jgi:hypothetical protein
MLLMLPLVGWLTAIVAVLSAAAARLARRARYSPEYLKALHSRWLLSPVLQMLQEPKPKPATKLADVLNSEVRGKKALLSPLALRELVPRATLRTACSRLVEAYASMDEQRLAYVVADAFLNRP